MLTSAYRNYRNSVGFRSALKAVIEAGLVISQKRTFKASASSGATISGV